MLQLIQPFIVPFNRNKIHVNLMLEADWQMLFVQNLMLEADWQMLFVQNLSLSLEVDELGTTKSKGPDQSLVQSPESPESPERGKHLNTWNVKLRHNKPL